ncbi:unnamed protein product [Bursaphelenchus okinawaensis]|uniref:EGF-like domain-containing protein n=1 Tax=Bursaphelenchus okinawaensis TaxID=465554 RepID=A0A811KVT2_9BILA|nr:unnamed protein product [Bursaphelenchus okinawaensis]CAG9112247.1 unnamed protein product [Bursaphelenchus okinawaensis]
MGSIKPFILLFLITYAVSQEVCRTNECKTGKAIVTLKYYCICDSGFCGQRCELREPCPLKPRSLLNTTLALGDKRCSTVKLDCEHGPGKIFDKLERSNDLPPNWAPCAQNVCKNGGTCYEDGGAEFCTCASNFGGELCERMLELANKDSEESRIASLSLVCWILALAFCLSLCFGVMGWMFFRKARHENEELQEEIKKLQTELKLYNVKKNVIIRKVRTKPEEATLLAKDVP